jgi:ribosomal protein L9
MEKQRFAGAVKNGDCMDVNLVFDANTLIEEFMAMVSTQRKQKNNHAKKQQVKRKRRSLTPFS